MAAMRCYEKNGVDLFFRADFAKAKARTLHTHGKLNFRENRATCSHCAKVVHIVPTHQDGSTYFIIR